MKIDPRNDVVLLQLEPAAGHSDIILAPGTAVQPIRKGVVLRVGPGRVQLVSASGSKTRFLHTELQPGDRVAFFAAAADTQRANHQLDDGQVLIRESDVLFVLEEDAKVEVC